MSASEPIDEPRSKNRNYDPAAVKIPEMPSSTDRAPLGDGENSDIENITKVFRTFSSVYGIRESEPGQKLNRKVISKAVDSMINKNSEFLSEMNRKHQDYHITDDNSEEVVSDMTSLLRPYFENDQRYNAFKSRISSVVYSGLKLCVHSVFQNGIDILSFTNDFFFVVIFTLKIYRTEKGIFVSYPAITGKYSSYLLKVSTSTFLKFLEIGMENSHGQDVGSIAKAVSIHPELYKRLLLRTKS
jgi:hypothetical protein